MISLYAKLNKISMKLQRNQLNLIKTKRMLSLFVTKHLLYNKILGRGECSHFYKLS